MHLFKEVKRAVAAGLDFRVNKQSNRNKACSPIFKYAEYTAATLSACELHVRSQLKVRL